MGLIHYSINSDSARWSNNKMELINMKQDVILGDCNIKQYDDACRFFNNLLSTCDVQCLTSQVNKTYKYICCNWKYCHILSDGDEMLY